jgi:hypothetical protein
MDYKNIEQLLERYWRCETSLEEENQLRDLFNNEEVPAQLLPYKDLFVYQKKEQTVGLGADFDARILAKIEKPVVVKAKRMTIVSRLKPLFRAAAVVTAFLMLGNVAQRSLFQNDALDYNYNNYKDTYDDPNVAYKKVSSALLILSDEINKSQSQTPADSIKAAPDSVMNE